MYLKVRSGNMCKNAVIFFDSVWQYVNRYWIIYKWINVIKILILVHYLNSNSLQFTGKQLPEPSYFATSGHDGGCAGKGVGWEGRVEGSSPLIGQVPDVVTRWSDDICSGRWMRGSLEVDNEKRGYKWRRGRIRGRWLRKQMLGNPLKKNMCEKDGWREHRELKFSWPSSFNKDSDSIFTMSCAT